MADRADGAFDDDKALTPEETKALLRGLLRYPSLMQDALRLGFEASQLSEGAEVGFYYLAAAACNLFKLHKALTEEMLTTELRAWQEGNPALFAPEHEVLLFGDGEEPGFITVVFKTPPLGEAEERAERSYLESLLRRFLQVRMIRREIQAAIHSTPFVGNGKFVPLRDRLARWAQAAQEVEFMGQPIENAAYMPAFGEPIKLPPPPVETGIPWVDQYLGGFRKGDVIGLLGPTGGGKSTMMAVAAVRMAQNFYHRGENKLSVFICYEDPDEKTAYMFFSAAAHIDRELFNNPDFWTQFSSRENLKPYDYQLPENRNGKIVLGEKERWEAVQPWYRKHFFLLDFSSGIKSGNRGSGGVPEIVATLRRLSEETGMEIGFVAIDYAGLLVNRELARDNRTRNMEQVWRPLQQLPDQLRTMLAIPTGATVVLAHQIAGAEVKKIPPYRYLTHWDAQGSKAFAENLHACICLNDRDKSVNVSTMNYSKIRSRLPRTPFGLVQIDQKVVDVHLVDKEYEASESARRIVRRGEAGLVMPDEGTLRPEKKQPKPPKIDRFGEDYL